MITLAIEINIGCYDMSINRLWVYFYFTKLPKVHKVTEC